MADARPAPFFVADDLALDFLNSVASPWGAEIEWVANGGDLVAWLEAGHALPGDASAWARGHVGARALDAVAAQARELREWFRGFVGNHAGRPLTRRALRELAPLNRLLEHDETFRQVEIAPRDPAEQNDADGYRALRWQARRRWDKPGTLLLPIADAMGDLICSKDFALVRQCEGATCTLWFLDVSKAHARRWCSMAVCGNRAKAAAHRARARQHLDK